MNDKEHIQRVLEGNREAFRFLVDKYQEKVFRTAMGFVHQQEEAEDITQETFIRAYQSLQTFQGDSEFSTWLYRIAINTCLNTLSQKRKNIFIRQAEKLMQKALHLKSYEPDPQEQLVNQESSERIRKAIDNLPEKQRLAFTLSKYDDLPQKEIAEILKISEGAVEQLLQRAKINLKKTLKCP